MLPGILPTLVNFPFLPAGNNSSEVGTYRRAGNSQKAQEVRSFCYLKKVPYESGGITSAQT